MSEDASFAELIARVRARDAAATDEVLKRFGPTILRTARMRMFNSRLRRMFESADIENSVVKSFLVRIADEGNSWKIDEPADLANLLISMTDHKVIDKIRRESAKKRGGDQPKQSLESGDNVGDRRPTPEAIAIMKEEASRCWDLMDQEIRRLFEMRYDEQQTWSEIGANLGQSGEACRKKLERALGEVRQQRERETPG